MRTVITYAVEGGSLDELRERALAQYRALTCDPEAEIPYSATVEVSPEATMEARDGSVAATTWRGEVSITVPADGGQR